MSTVELLVGALARYFSTDVGTSPPAEGFPVSELYEGETLRSLIESQPAKMVRGPEDRVSGIMVSKVYGAYPLAVIFSGSLFDRALPIAPEEVFLTPGGSHGFRFWLPISALEEAPKLVGREAGVPELGANQGSVSSGAVHLSGRAAAFRSHLEDLFEDHVAPVFSLLEKRTGGDQRSMWSLLSTNIKTVYLRGRLEAYRRAFGIDEARAAVLERDETMIFREGAEGPFSHRDRNPLVQATRLFVPPEGLGEPMYLRTKCCLRYRIIVDGEAVPYCGSCPKINDEQRIRLLRELHAEERE